MISSVSIYLRISPAASIYTFNAVLAIGIIFYNFRSAGTAHEWHT